MPVAAVMAVTAIAGNVASNKARSSAASSSAKAAGRAEDFVQQGQAQARQDLLSLFPSAIQSGQQGFQAAANVFQDVVPQQSQIFQQGNINAQNTLLAGLPQQQNAILGGNVNLGALQPTTQFQPDFGFLNQQIGQPAQGQEGGGFGDQLLTDLSQPTLRHQPTPQGAPSRFDIMQNFLNNSSGGNTAISNMLAGNQFRNR